VLCGAHQRWDLLTQDPSLDACVAEGPSVDGLHCGTHVGVYEWCGAHQSCMCSLHSAVQVATNLDFKWREVFEHWVQTCPPNRPVCTLVGSNNVDADVRVTVVG
jgi:hypothetical protein